MSKYDITNYKIDACWQCKVGVKGCSQKFTVEGPSVRVGLGLAWAKNHGTIAERN